MGGKGSQKQTVNQVQSPWGPAQPLLQAGLDEAMQLYRAGQLTPTPYGNRLAEESPYSQIARNGMAAQAMLGNPAVKAAMPAYTNMLNADPYAELGAVEDQALARAVPAAAGYFENSGMMNSSLAGRGIGEAAAGAIAPIKFGAYNDAQNRRLSALGMAPAMADLNYNDARMLTAAGAMDDARRQAEKDANVAAYYEAADAPYQNLQRLSSIGLGFGGAGGSMSGSQKAWEDQGAMGTIGSIMQTVGPLLAMFAMSDRRLKTDIKKVGMTDTRKGKVPLYEFKYKDDPSGQVYRGVMADEVHEDAVVHLPDGHKAVNYGVL